MLFKILVSSLRNTTGHPTVRNTTVHPTGEVVMVQDFGEKRKASYNAEIKFAHFGKRQMTIHLIVSYRVGMTYQRLHDFHLR